MNYQVLYTNDNGTAKVRMTINDRILEQDFAIDDLENNILAGMAVFKSEIERQQQVQNIELPIATDTVIEVTELPPLPEPEEVEGE